MDTSLLSTFSRPSRDQDDAPAQVTRSHKRTDTAVSKIVRPENDWSFTPAELLADAVWLLQADNKACIENRHGHKIFPPRPRSSFESARSGRRSGDSRPSMSRTDTWGSTVKSDDETDRGRKKPKFLSLRHVDNTARKHLFRNRSRSSSVSSTSSRPSDRKKRFLGPGNNPDIDNTGPLERQMKKLIERESLSIEQQHSPDFVSPDKWDRQPEQATSAESPSVTSHKRNDSSKTEDNATAEERARSSFDDSTAPSSPVVPNFIPSFGMSLSPPPSRQSSPERKFGLFKTGNKNPSDDKINRTDFAAASRSSLNHPRHVSDNTDPPRSSMDSIRPPEIRRHRTTNSISNALFTSGRRMSKDVGVSRFFKSGRIGDLVRSDSSRNSKVDLTRKKEQQVTSDASDADTVSESEDDNEPRKMPPASRSHTTIVGATPKEKEKQKYHIPNLPSFKSSNQVTESDLEPTSSDPIARQNKLHRDQSRSSRFDRLAPPRINLPNNDSDASPTRKQPISRTSSDDDATDMLTPLRKTRASGRAPGSFQSSLATIEGDSPERQPSPGKRHWSISDRRIPEPEIQQVTPEDIARVRALYLSSGIKAYEICNRADSLANPPSDFFCRAAEISGDGVHAVMLREEYTVAGRMLSKAINTGTSKLEHDLSDFRSTMIPELHSRLDELRHRVDEKFTPLVHSTADEADAFTVALTTQHTLAIKQVNDAIDGVLRRRRRNFIFLQKATFTVLEWVLLGVMWCVWFIVVIIRFFRGIVVGFGKGAKWMLWL